MKHRFVALTVILALATASANAADLSQPALPTPAMPTGSTVPNSAFFLGLGASANWTNFGHQHVYAIGTSNVYTDGVLSASGSAQGPTNIHMEDRFASRHRFRAATSSVSARATGYGERNSRTIIWERLRPIITRSSPNSGRTPRYGTRRPCPSAARLTCAPLRRVFCRRSISSRSLAALSVRATSTPEAVRRSRRPEPG
jgi:hypothetical protein